MNISHLEYFVTVVEENFNMSNAANKLFVSQPALSNFIVRFEKTESVELFIRKKGRLTGLTSAGEILYNKSKSILHEYNIMMSRIRDLSHHHSGVIRIGIPPLVLSVLFTDLISTLISCNSNIKFEIMEHGAYKLIDEIEQDNLDIAIVLHPNYINSKKFNEVVLFKDELSAYINEDHPLAQNKEFVTWDDLSEGSLAIFDKDFMIYHYIISKFEKNNLTPNITIETRSWDFLVSVVRQTGLISILPSPSKKYTNTKGIKVLKIKDPIPWNVSMIYPKKDKYSFIETYLINSIKEYFLYSKNVFSIDESISTV